MSCVVTLCALFVSLGGTAWWFKRRKRNSGDVQSFIIPDAPRDTVILHQYGPSPFVPSISPFVMKLETYLRVAQIPYINQYDRKPGPKGKLPWIQYNDDVISDSQIIIDFLNKEFNVCLNNKLTNEQKALGHVIRRMVEEWLYWVLVMWRLVFEVRGTIYRKLGLPSLIIWYMRRTVRPRLWSQGIGRHSQQEVTQMMEQDLNSLDDLLGNKKYIFGETRDDVTEFDCALFGQLCQMTWQMPDCGVEEFIHGRHPRLVAYCERMKEQFWPDWNDRLKKTLPTTPSTQPAGSSIPPPSPPSTSSSPISAKVTATSESTPFPGSVCGSSKTALTNAYNRNNSNINNNDNSNTNNNNSNINNNDTSNTNNTALSSSTSFRGENHNHQTTTRKREIVNGD